MDELLATYANLINFLGINALLALSIYTTLACGQLSLGNAAFQGIGAYTAVLLGMRAGWPFAASLLAGVALGALAAFLLGLPVLRLRGVYLAIATIGFGEIVRIALLNATPLTGGARGINGVPPLTQTWQIYLAVLSCSFCSGGSAEVDWATPGRRFARTKRRRARWASTPRCTRRWR